MQKKILIITHTVENDCVPNVTKYLEKQGALVYRFDSDLFPLHTSMTGKFSSDGYYFELKTPEYTIDLNEIDALWYRRLSIGGGLQNVMNPEYLRPTIDESHVSLWGVLNSIKAFQMDSYIKHRIANNKFTQLKLAEQIGMNIPSTLVTNNSDHLAPFYQEQQSDIIMKMHHSFAIYDHTGNENVVFTNKFPEQYLSDKKALQLCPLTFQKNLVKKRELRVTVVGEKIFSAAVDSQKMERAQYDWRKEGEALLDDWYEYDIPSQLKKQILKLMDLYQLNYGAMDFIETPDGKFHFLEVNSGGEFMWLDTLFQGKISESIADVLLGNVKRRNKLFPMYS